MNHMPFTSKINFYLQPKIYLSAVKIILYSPSITHNYHMIIFLFSRYHITLEIYFIKKIVFFQKNWKK